MDMRNAKRDHAQEREKAKARYASDPEKYRNRVYVWSKAQHPARIAEMRARQDGAPWATGQLETVINLWDLSEICPLCDRTFTGKARERCIDHDHVTGKVRAVVCRKCNSGLGMFEDSARAMVAAAQHVSSDVDYVWDI